MGLNRHPIQGIANIIRFNWHFYLFGIAVWLMLLLATSFFSGLIQMGLILATSGVGLALINALVVSFFIYDRSDLYQLNWIKNANKKSLLTVNAGFDETSEIIVAKFPETRLTICDFYDPNQHTEVSIKRARRRYPPDPQTISVHTNRLPFPDNAFDESLAILSAHEIRNPSERAQFFNELRRVTRGRILVTEHLRDLNNLLTYTIGAFHFYTRKTWMHTFELANLTVVEEIKTTPFITTFVLEKNGNTF